MSKLRNRNVLLTERKQVAELG